MAKKVCTQKIKTAGANLVKSRKMAEAMVEQLMKTYRLVKDAEPDLVALGAKHMEFGLGLELMADAMRAEGLIGAAHNSFRQMLGKCDMEEPTDDDIIVILGGGGGGR